jgi:hypothetical protein
MTENRKLFLLIASFVVVGILASSTGIADSPVDLWLRPASAGWIPFAAQAGYLACYLILIFAFSGPGWRLLLTALAPGVVTATIYLAFADQPDLKSTPRSVYEIYFLISSSLIAAFLAIVLVYRRFLATVTQEERRRTGTIFFLFTAIALLSVLPPTYLDILPRHPYMAYVLKPHNAHVPRERNCE